MGLFVLLQIETSTTIPGPPPQLLTDALLPIVIGCPASPLVGSKCTMYAYTYIFGDCGGQLLGFRN